MVRSSAASAAAHLGARLSSFFAMFPVMSTVLVGFAHAGPGRGSAVALLRGMVAGYFGFSVFCGLLALQLRPGAVGPAFALALGCAFVVHMVARRMLAPPVPLSNAGSAPGFKQALLKSVTLSQYCSNPFNRIVNQNHHEEQDGARRKRNPWLSS